ncbi:MAG TPA: hypothetical protein VHU82_15300 [Vicinamibacterales bacterium]|nr:hypothetical protein [Vicinamibacterales bacterium]
MRIRLFVLLTFTCTAATLAAQTTTSKTDRTPPKPITLSGCVQPSDSSPNRFTFSDDGNPNAPASYRLSGTDMRKYAGKRVEIVGGVVTSRLKIATGLYPSPNVAGQAGAMDPTQAAVAGSAGGSASGTGNVELPEFRVKSVKTLGGACPQ